MKLSSKILLLVAAFVILFRIALPFSLRHAVNKYLGHLENYSGHVDDVSLSFYKGSYTLSGLRIWKKERAEFQTFISVPKLEVSLLSHLAVDKKWLAGVDVYEPRVQVIDSFLPSNQQFGDSLPWREVLNKLVVLDIESLRIRDGIFLFQNYDYRKPVQISVSKINISAINIHNTEGVTKNLPSRLNFSALVQREAWLGGSFDFNGSTSLPSFYGQVRLDDFHLTRMNNVFILYGPYSFRLGRASLFSRIFVNNGNIRGYLTPFLQNVDAVKMVWNNRISQGYLADAVKAFGGIVLDNHKQQRLKGRRYAFQGHMVAGEEPWKNFWSTVRNGFIPIYPKKPIAMKKKHIIAEQIPELDKD